MEGSADAVRERAGDRVVRERFERCSQEVDCLGEPLLLVNVVSRATRARGDPDGCVEEPGRIAGETGGEQRALSGQKRCDVCADERVALAQVVQKGQRLVASDGREP